MKARGEGDDRGWDGWMASQIRWTWVSATLGVGDGQGILVCCSPWGHKQLDTTEQLNWTELRHLTEPLFLLLHPPIPGVGCTISIFLCLHNQGHCHGWIAEVSHLFGECNSWVLIGTSDGLLCRVYQKVHSDFSVTSFGKTQMNFSANPTY